MREALADVGVSVLDCEHKTPAAQPSGLPYIAIPDIQDGRVLVSQARLISENDLAEWTRRTTPSGGDILITRRGRVGDTAPIPDGLRCAIGQNLVLIRSDGTMVDQGFLRWAVRSPQWWSEVDRLMNVGAVFSSLNVKDIARIRLDFPPLPEQQAIAEVLGALDDKIAANTALAVTTDRMIRAEYAALTADRVRVADVADSPRSGVSPASVNPHDLYVGLEHVGRRRMWLTDGGRAENVSSTKSRFEARDILFGKLRPYFHKVVSASRDGICSTDILVVRARDSRLSSILLAALSSDAVIEKVVAASEGTRMPRTNWTNLASVKIHWPGSESAERLAARLDNIRGATLAVLEENRTLAAARDALLPQFMSGKLRVRDAEAVASEAGA